MIKMDTVMTRHEIQMCLLHQSHSRSFSGVTNSYTEILISIKLGLLYFQPNVKKQIKVFMRISKIIF